MDTENSTMFYPDYTTPTRRQHAPVPLLDMKMTATARLDQGLMTPLSASSHCESRRNSDAQGVWSDAAFMQQQQQSYPTGHPNTPVQGLPDGNVSIGHYDHMRIQITGDIQHNVLPTPTSCTPTYSSFSFDDGLNGLSSPVDSTQQSVAWSVQPSACLSVDPQSSFSSSIVGLSAFGGLSVEDTSSTSFSSPFYGASTAASSFEGDAPGGSSQCIVPSHTLANPSQDLSQYISLDWHEYPTDNGYTTPPSHPSARFFSPASPMHDVQFKLDPYPSESPEPGFTLLRTAPKTKSARRAKKERKHQARQTVHKGCTSNGVVIECFIDEKAGKHFSGASSTAPKKYECKFYGCDKMFARSEHQKRHMKSHDDSRPYHCYIEGCKSVNRNDNASDHAFTHLKSWISSEGAAQRIKLTGRPGKKNKGRNSAVHPKTLRRAILERHVREQPDKAQKVFDIFNRKAGADFGIHFDFSRELCEMRPCDTRMGAGACRTCQGVASRKTPASRVSRL